MLEARGFKVAKQSIDKDKSAYTNLRSAAQEFRLRVYRHNHLYSELENLLDGDKHVDHPPKGSKDTSDSVAGALSSAINSEEKATMMAPQNPRVHMNRDLEHLISEKPLVEINLPPGYERLKTFKL
jgi:hypothetical protein